MAQATKPKRQNRTITVDFKDETSYFHLLDDGKAFVEFVLAFILSLVPFLSVKAVVSHKYVLRQSMSLGFDKPAKKDRKQPYSWGVLLSCIQLYTVIVITK